MATIISDRGYTPEDLLKMPDGERYELVDGQLVETAMSGIAGWITALIINKLMPFVLQQNLGILLPSDTQFQCFPADPRRVRKPDVAFIQRSRFVPQMLRGYVRIAPDLAIEVVSEHDTYYEVETKVREYLQAGVRLIWVFNPATRSIRIYRLNGTQQELFAGDTLSGEEILPGFQVEVAELFRLPESDVELT